MIETSSNILHSFRFRLAKHLYSGYLPQKIRFNSSQESCYTETEPIQDNSYHFGPTHGLKEKKLLKKVMTEVINTA